jgi:polyhydroxybutyrate depolymerase
MVGVANQRHNRRKTQQAPIARKAVTAMRIRACPSAIRHCVGTFAVPIAIVALAVAVARADGVITLAHQGVERTAILHEAAGAARSAPLVIALQGLGQSTEQLRGALKLDPVADREGFAVLYPDAIEHKWSYGRPINQPMPTVGGETVDDVGFLRLLIEDLVSRKVADPARVYVTGMSRGGLMAFTLACALADKIAAAAALITGMTEAQREDCRPARPVPIMALAGTNDWAQSYDGWLTEMGRLLSVPETMEFWRALHGCGQQDRWMLPHRDDRDRTRVVLIEWSGCKSGARLRLYRINGGGHQIPSLTAIADAQSEQRWGLRSRDVETAEEVWTYVKGYAR